MNQSPNEFDDSDPVIDSILGEYLGGKKPRALDSDTLNGIVANSTFLEDEELRRLDFACAKAELELEVASQRSLSVLGPKVTVAPELASPAPRSLTSRLAFGSLAMLAACLLILASSFLAVNRQPSEKVPSHSELTENQLPGHSDASIEPAQPTPRVENVVADNTDELELPRKLPFEQDRELSLTKPDQTTRVAAKWSANQQQLLDTINSQFEQLWNRTKVTKANSIDGSQWAQRASLALTGKSVRSDMLGQLASGQDSVEARKQFVDQLMQTDDFAQYWANRLLTHYFNVSSSAGARKDNLSRARDLVAAAIKDDRPITEMWKPLLSADDSSAGQWLVSHKGQDAKTSASQLLSVGIGNQSSCVQCHIGDNAKLKEIAGADLPDQFWHLAALLHKVQLQDDAKIDWQMDRDLFYDVSDKQILATPAFASIDNSAHKAVANRGDAAAALKSWGAWLSSSQKSREYFVETVWKGLFHLPLGSSVYDKAEYDELVDLKSFLAQQRNGSDDSLRALIASIVLSDVFAVPTVEITESWYLVASDANIEQMRQQTRLFSHYSIAPEPTIADNRQLVRWLATFNQPARELLAQPSQVDLENTKVVPKPKKEKPSLSSSQLEWLVRSKHYSPGTAEWIARLSNSQMNWEMVINHVYSAELGRDANQEEMQSAKAMLDISGNRSIALARILASLSLQ